MARPRKSELPFGRATKLIAAKTVALYNERISGGDIEKILADCLVVEIPENGKIESLLLMTLIQPAVIAYKSGSITIGLVTDSFGKNLFTLNFGDILLGYYEPIDESH